MRRTIRKAAVLGAGVMGSRIAALLAGVDIPVYLLDIVPPELDAQDQKKGFTKESPTFRNKLATQGIQGTIGTSPPAMFVPDDARLVKPGNFEDHLEWLVDADWVIEAVAEDLEIKKSLLSRVEPNLKADAILSTNTSGISIERISEGLSEATKKCFLGTHFFNPPRHMKLLEIIPGGRTDPEVVSFMSDFCENRLGKSIVFAKDTPNFIANRIGAQAMIAVMQTMVEDGYTIEEADAVTGPPMGRPRSASFRTSDMVGIDTIVKVAQNVAENVRSDAEKSMFAVPDFVKQMVEKGLLGDKAQQGFYKKVPGPGGSQIQALDYKSMEYVAQRKPSFPVLDKVAKEPDPAERVATVVYSDDRAGAFAWKVTRRMLLYCADKVPEIADDVVSVDRAMSWGYNWELGPFETWDAIGLRKSVERMEREGESLPANVSKMLESGHDSFYRESNGRQYFYDFSRADYVEIKEKPKVIILPSLKDRARVVKTNAGASLIDIGDGVACLEFHSRSNAIDPDIIQMMSDSVDAVEESFEGLVIGNQGTNFCVGADLRQMYPAAASGQWDALEQVAKNLQQACMKLKYCERPVVATPHRMALGGGCEVVMAAARVRASAEAYIGLVEMGVGLIPSGGGTKELLLRSTDWVPKEIPSAVPGGGKPDLLPYVSKAFETIAMAKVSSCAREAQELAYITRFDSFTMNPDHVLHDAKQVVLDMVREGYHRPRPRDEIRVTGRSGRGLLELLVYLLKEGLYISEHDAVIAKKLAYVVTGGDVDENTLVTEQYLLDLEREAFLSLCGEPKSQERMKHMMETNKPLRN